MEKPSLDQKLIGIFMMIMAIFYILFFTFFTAIFFEVRDLKFYSDIGRLFAYIQSFWLITLSGVGFLLILKARDLIKFPNVHPIISAYTLSFNIFMFLLLYLPIKQDLKLAIFPFVFMVIVPALPDIHILYEHYKAKPDFKIKSKKLSFGYYLVGAIILSLTLIFHAFPIGGIFYKSLFGVYYNDTCYYMDCTTILVKLDNVDFWSFEPILDEDEFLSYAKDKDNVYLLIQNGTLDPDTKKYYETIMIKGADPSTFEIVSGSYAKDASHVYYYGRVLNGAVPENFQKLSDDRYTGDYKDLYLKMYTDLINVYFADNIVGSYNNKVDIENKSYGYRRINENLYFNKYKLEDADLNTFEVLGQLDLARDARTVFVSGRKIDIFNPASFKIIDKCYLLNNNKIYFYYEPDLSGKFEMPRELPEADLATFESNEASNSYCAAKDKNHEYEYDKIVK